MNASSEKTAPPTSTSVTRTTSQPFFAKAGAGSFFEPATPATIAARSPLSKEAIRQAASRPPQAQPEKLPLPKLATVKKARQQADYNTQFDQPNALVPPPGEGPKPQLLSGTSAVNPVVPERSLVGSGSPLPLPERGATALLAPPAAKLLSAAATVPGSAAPPLGTVAKFSTSQLPPNLLAAALPLASSTELSPAQESDRSPLPGQGGAPASNPTPNAAPKATEQIAAAPVSPNQVQAATQAQLLTADAGSSEQHVLQLAATRKQQVSALVSEARSGLWGFFATSIAGMQAFIGGKQAELTSLATGVLASVRATVAGALQAAQVASLQLRGRLGQVLAGLTTATQSRVAGIIGQLTGLLDSVPLPDIPGVAQVRGLARGLLQQGAGFLSRAFGRFLSFANSTLNASLTALATLLGQVGQMAETTIGAIFAAISHVSQAVSQALGSVLTLLQALGQRAWHRFIDPLLTRIQVQLVGLIDGAMQRTRYLLLANRDRYLALLAAALGLGDGAAPAQAPERRRAIIQQLGRAAVQNNQLLVSAFVAVLSGAIASLGSLLAVAAARLGTSVRELVAQAAQQALALVAYAAQFLAQLTLAAGHFAEALRQALEAALGGLLAKLRAEGQAGADFLLQFAQNGFSQIGRVVRRFLSGWPLGAAAESPADLAAAEFSPPKVPAPQSFLAPPPLPPPPPPVRTAIVVIITRIVVAIAGALSATSIAIAVVVAALIGLVYWLLRRWAMAPKPLPPTAPVPLPPGPPAVCGIATRTLAAAPDGTASTRLTVGVGEEVALTATGPATWAAQHGTLSPAIGSATTWTAPAVKTTTSVKATLAPGNECDVRFTVLAPTKQAFLRIKDISYLPNEAGSGFDALMRLMPRNVSFSRVQVKEGEATATATGYYDTVCNWNGIIHSPAASWILIGPNNGGGTDNIGTPHPGSPPPFSTGFFYWGIPQLYRILGDPTETIFAEEDHLQEMLDATGQETTSKGDAIRTRTP